MFPTFHDDYNVFLLKVLIYYVVSCNLNVNYIKRCSVTGTIDLGKKFQSG